LIKRINLKLGSRSYDICIGNGILKHSGVLIKSACTSKKYFVLTVDSVFKKYGTILSRSLKRFGFIVHVFPISDGEIQKNENTLFLILKKMAQLRLQRDCCLVTLGGGVVGDIGGFAASIYMRGINFVQCPTTFLAQVDASIGGKTGVDFYGIKNLIGSFYQPKLVLIDPEVLKTLNDRQFRTGLAEVIKYGMIKDPKMFEKIEKNLQAILEKNPTALLSLISKSCQIKAEIVSGDEREEGERAWLNYGHTLGHALESYFGYRFLTHGEAVAYGMWFAALLSLKMKLCTESTFRRQVELLKKVDLLQRLPRFSIQKVYEKMLLDKKARSGKIQFVLTRKIGLVTIQKNVPRSFILSALNQLQAESSLF
jgi:3-dehydroquinate synthase